VLTAGCNLRCTYCYQNDKKPRSMSWETLRSALDLVVRSRRRRVHLLFLGGEPLLEFPLIGQAIEYVRSVRAPGKRIGYSMVTNGTLLREEQAAFLARHRFSIHLSFDGVPAAQDLRGAHTFPILDALLDRLRRDHPRWFRDRLTIGLTLTPATLPHLRDSIAYFIRKGVPRIDISPIVTHDAGWRPERIEALEQAFAGAFEVCLRHYKRTGEIPLQTFRKIADASPHHPRPDAMCAAPSGRNLAVDVDGQIHGCVVFAESYQAFRSPLQRQTIESIRMGDFRAPEFKRRLAMYPDAARATGIFHAKREKYSSYGRCGECRFLDTCSICPASIGNIPGNTDPRRVPDFPCAYNLVALKYREKFPAQPTPLDVLTGRVRAYGPLGETQRRMLAAIRQG
jgi:sulfatase maturation enzyme AslB (radical SAM superfamily)